MHEEQLPLKGCFIETLAVHQVCFFTPTEKLFKIGGGTGQKS